MFKIHSHENCIKVNEADGNFSIQFSMRFAFYFAPNDDFSSLTGDGLKRKICNLFTQLFSHALTSTFPKFSPLWEKSTSVSFLVWLACEKLTDG